MRRGLDERKESPKRAGRQEGNVGVTQWMSEERKEGKGGEKEGRGRQGTRERKVMCFAKENKREENNKALGRNKIKIGGFRKRGSLKRKQR